MGKSQKGLSQGQQLALGVAEKLLAPDILARIDVSKSTLAKVAGQSRPTFYRHLKAMGLGEEANPMDLEGRAEYIRSHFTVKSVEDLLDYARENAFYRNKTPHRAYDNSGRAAKAQTLRQSRAKQTHKQTVDQSQANSRVLAEVSALTGQKAAPAPAKTAAKEGLPFDPHNLIAPVIAPVTPHLLKLLTRYYIQNSVKKPQPDKQWLEIEAAPTAKAARNEREALAKDPKNEVNVEKWALWYYVKNFAEKKQRETIKRSLQLGYFDGKEDDKDWAFALYIPCHAFHFTAEMF